MKVKVNTIDLSHLQYDSLYFVGDIHGEFKTICFKLINQYCIKNAVVIICGDIGVGFYKCSYYNDLFTFLSVKLKENNITIICVRGNHDNPDYFYNPEKYLNEYYSKYNNILLVKDYDVICTTFGNILCVGGGRSIDRVYRIKDFDYWEKENVISLTKTIYDKINKLNKSINIIATHVAPLFCEPSLRKAKDFGDKYVLSNDMTIDIDCLRERKIMSYVYNKLSKSNEIKYWFYGHYHHNYYYDNNRTKFYGLTINEIKLLL